MFLHHQYWPLSPVIPAGRAPSNPVTTPWPIVQGHLYSIRVQVPAGHNGLTGFRVTYFGQEIMPWSNNAWLVGSGDVFDLEWDNEIMATGLALVAYNTDLVAHQFWALANIVPELGTAPAAYGTPADLAAGTPAQLALIGALHS